MTPSRILACVLVCFVSFAASAEEPEPSADELNKQLTNPVSSLWSIQFQQNNYLLDMGPGENERWNSNVLFQPVLPVGITDNWNLITRPVITVFNSVPHPEEDVLPIEWTRTETFGDSTLMELISPSPKQSGNWLLGLGPTFIFPTANSKWTGQGKYQVGPAGLVGYLADKWIAGVLVQQWTSFSGAGSSRDDVSQMNVQPIGSVFLPHAWNIFYSGNVLANFKADGGDVWTVPLGVGVGKVTKLGKLPVKFTLAVQYMVVHPDTFGQKWNFQLQVTPVLPKLIHGNLAEPSTLRFGLK